MRLTLLSSVLTVSLLSSTVAFAAGDAAIRALPNKGHVSVGGTIDRVVNKETFVLRDAEGDTIQVKTRDTANLRQGEYVKVKGEKESKMMGRDTINNASVMAGKNHQKTSAKGDKSAAGHHAHNKQAAAGAAATTTHRAHERSQLANPVPKDARDSFRSHRVAYGSEMWERNEAYRKDGVNAVAEGNPAYHHRNSIAELPRRGNVTLTGVVDNVRNENTFILRDTHGKTIDVHTMSQARLRPGDAVNVNGNVSSEMLGFGRQIENAQVNVMTSKR